MGTSTLARVSFVVALSACGSSSSVGASPDGGASDVGGPPSVMGALDTSFGAGGKVTSSFASSASAQGLAIGKDGRIFVAGALATGTTTQAVVLRFTAAGTIDASFGDKGVATLTGLGNLTGTSQTIVLGADGRLVVVTMKGTEGTRLARLDDAGAIDSTFVSSSDARLKTIVLGAIARQTDGKIVAVGGQLGAAVSPWIFARFLPDGALDDAFGDHGMTEVKAAPTGQSFPHAIAVEKSGRIVAAGGTTAPSAFDFTLVALDGKGQPDGTFGASGIRHDGQRVDEGALGIAARPDQGVVAVGTSDPYLALQDTSPSGTGNIEVVFRPPTVTPQPTIHANAVVVPSDGHAILVGSTARVHSGDVNDFAAWRVGASSSEGDPGFGAGGVLSVDFGGKGDIACCVAMTPDGAVVMAGTTGGGEPGWVTAIGLVRFK